MSMQPSFSSGDFNPFLSVAKAFGKMGGKSDVQSQALAMHQAHYASHQYGMEMESHKAALQEQASAAQHGRNMEFFGSVLRHAKHETPIHLSVGDVTTQFTKKPKQMRSSQTPTSAPAKTPRPLPVRDPKTGRAMKAPE